MCFFTRKLRYNNISLNKVFEDTFKRNSIQTLEMRMVFDGAFLDVTHGVMQGTEDAGVDPTSAKEVILPEDTAFSVVPLELPQDDEGGKEDPVSSLPAVAFSEDAGVDPTSVTEVILPEDRAFSLVPLELPQDDEGGKEDPVSSLPAVAFSEDAGVDPTSAKEVILGEDTAFSVIPLELPQDDEGGKEDPFSSLPYVALDAGGEGKLWAAVLARMEAEHYFGKEEYETFCFLFSNLHALYHSNLRGFDLFKDRGRENPNLNFNLPALPFSEGEDEEEYYWMVYLTLISNSRLALL